MANSGSFKLRVGPVPVFTNLEVQLKTRTKKEEALKEAERFCEEENIADGYEWRIEGCSNGGLGAISPELREAIIERIEEDPEESVDWNGMTACYELNVFHVPVPVFLEVRLKASGSREDAVREVNQMVAGNNLFQDYEWNIEGCADGGINEFDDALQNAILNRLGNKEAWDKLIEEM